MTGSVTAGKTEFVSAKRTLRLAQQEWQGQTGLGGLVKKAMKKSELKVGKRACLALRCERRQVIQGEGGE